MNILSFDIEEWVLEKELHGGRKERYLIFEETLSRILKLLDDYNQTGTFFCVGELAKSFPHVIKEIASCGHEIGSHSYAHKWVTKMSAEEFRNDTLSAIHALEDISGKQVVSFRAPAFSIGESNKWALEVLVECGITNDASIFPGVRDFGGFPSFNEQSPCRIAYNDCVLNEFPIPLYRLPIIGKKFAYSGGGYFRLLPLTFVERCLNANDYNMCYFHISDFLTGKVKLMTKTEYEDYFKEPGTLKNRYIRYAKANIGRGNTMRNLEKLLTNYHFISISDFLKTNTIDRTIRI